MRQHRFPLNLPLQIGQNLILPEAVAQHGVRVLRLRVGDHCVLFNGDGHDYTAIITSIQRQQLHVRITDVQPVQCESLLTITLLQGIARGEKMDWILQKATELGVKSIIPVNSQRSQVRLDESRAEKRWTHWQAVVAAACAQSGRARIPKLSMPSSLLSALQSLPAEALRLNLDPEGGQRLADLQQPEQGVIVAIGPEGGWSALDRQQLHAAGFQGLRLGPRILRTETAGLAALAALQLQWGDF